MKAPYCAVCFQQPKLELLGEREIGDYVEFIDYKPLSAINVGHPYGFEWFCSDHIEFVKSNSHLSMSDAVDAAIIEFEIDQSKLSFDKDFYSKYELWVLSIGNNKLKFLSELRECLELSPVRAKALSCEKEFMVAKGHNEKFTQLIERLQKVGAKLEIRYGN